MEGRVVVIHNLAQGDPRLSVLTKNVREIFEHTIFRSNFFRIDHNFAELTQSVRSQSVKIPVNFIFHSSCSRTDASKLTGKVGVKLQTFSIYSHHNIDGGEKELIEVRSTILRKCAQERERQSRHVVKNQRRAA